MSENLNEQANIDTTGLESISEGFSGLTTANNQNINNTQEKGFSGVVTVNTDTPSPPPKEEEFSTET